MLKSSAQPRKRWNFFVFLSNECFAEFFLMFKKTWKMCLSAIWMHRKVYIFHGFTSFLVWFNISMPSHIIWFFFIQRKLSFRWFYESYFCHFLSCVFFFHSFFLFEERCIFFVFCFTLYSHYICSTNWK